MAMNKLLYIRHQIILSPVYFRLGWKQHCVGVGEGDEYDPTVLQIVSRQVRFFVRPVWIWAHGGTPDLLHPRQPIRRRLP